MNETSLPPTAARVIVMTGATSGIGAVALRRLAARPDSRLIVGARGAGRAVPAGVRTLSLDLASLDSVRRFAEALIRDLDGTPIDVLVLNAGVSSGSLDGRTADGFETAFGVNHLAHYLLARLLTPHLSDHAAVIVTTSDTHDPATFPLAPRSIDAEALAHPSAARFAGGLRAYAASKLCNLLTARSLADSTDLRERGIRVLAYNPGMTAETGLGDLGGWTARLLRTVVLPVVGFVGRFRPSFAVGSAERAGEALAQLVTGAVTPPDGVVYVSLVAGEITYPAPSALARDDRVRDDLWARSAVMVGIVGEPARPA